LPGLKPFVLIPFFTRLKPGVPPVMPLFVVNGVAGYADTTGGTGETPVFPFENPR
jgi:hypothetical protein